MKLLMKIEEAADTLGVPKASLQSAAEQHGFIVHMGRFKYLESERLTELIKKCRGQRKEQGSTSTSIPQTGTSSTPESPGGQRAAQAAQKLKKSSGHTSPRKAGQVLPMSRKT